MRFWKDRARSAAAVFLAVVLIVSLIPGPVAADIYSGGRTSGYITAYFSPSLSSYGYTNYYTTAMCNWANITSALWFFYSTSDSTTYDKYYVADTSTNGLLGIMTPYKPFLWFYITAGFSDAWSYCTVTVYDNQMDNYSFTASERISNITHEIGHSISLAHPSSSHASVMNQGKQSIGPQSYDESELIRKWGP